LDTGAVGAIGLGNVCIAAGQKTTSGATGCTGIGD